VLHRGHAPRGGAWCAVSGGGMYMRCTCNAKDANVHFMRQIKLKNIGSNGLPEHILYLCLNLDNNILILSYIKTSRRRRMRILNSKDVKRMEGVNKQASRALHPSLPPKGQERANRGHNLRIKR